jgi:hypothetical protein
MYLGMNEEDYQNVLNNTPKIVAKRLGIADTVADEDLEKAIDDKDHIAFLIMKEFRSIYEKWWALSKSFSPEGTPDKLDELKSLVSSRNEIRNSLISYLNSKYGKAA